jgi:invasion protein IalB
VVFTIKAAIRWAAALLTIGGLAATAMAQESQQPPPKNSFGPRVQPQAGGKNLSPPEVIATHGDWKVQCQSAADSNAQQGGAPQKQCGMFQSAKSDKNPKVGITLIIMKAKQQNKDVTMMRLMAPIGVYLPTGVALEIDGAAVGRVPFTRCLPAPPTCLAFAEAQDQTLAKMKKGTAANFIIYEAPGIGLPLKISLNGFSAALDALTKL